MTTVPKGFLIAVEGIDGAGKSTICTLLAQWCGERGVACMLSKEPTGLKWGRELRESAKQGRLTLERELELFELDRRDHIERSIRPAMEAGSVVILDRYYWSTAAYQGARGADVREVMERHDEFAIKPDVIIVLDVDAIKGRERINGRGDKPNAFEDVESLMLARAIFVRLAEDSPSAFVVDSSASIRECWNQCLAIFIRELTEKVARELGPTPLAVQLLMDIVGD